MASTTATKTIVGVFSSVSEAQDAVRELEAEGISRDDISIVANKNATGYEHYEGSDKTSDVVADAGIGAAIGGVGGLLLSAVGAITIPVIGPILAAGPIVAALTGAGIGAAAGGLVGALTEHGIPEEEAKQYAEGVRRGDVLVTVRSEGNLTERVCDILDRHNAVDVDDRVSNWKGRGWSGYQDTASPLAPEELKTERTYYRRDESIDRNMAIDPASSATAISSTGVSGIGVDRQRSKTESGVGMSGAGTPETNAVRNNTTGLTGSSLSGGGSLGDSLTRSHDRSTDRYYEDSKTPDLDRDGKHGDNAVERGAGRAGEAIKEMGRDVKDWARDAKDKVKHAGHEVADSARDAGRDISDDTRELERERRYRSRVYDRTI